MTNIFNISCNTTNEQFTNLMENFNFTSTFVTMPASVNFWPAFWSLGFIGVLQCVANSLINLFKDNLSAKVPTLPDSTSNEPV